MAASKLHTKSSNFTVSEKTRRLMAEIGILDRYWRGLGLGGSAGVTE
jgi:hypothetical protein